jgi:hypothetical protein
MSRFKKFQVNDGLQLSALRWICKQVARLATVTFLLCGLLSLDASVASAMQFELSDDAKLDVDVSLTYGAAWRAKSSDSFLADGDPTHPFRLGSAGDGNFDRKDMINNRFSAMVDIDFQYKDYGIFVRPRAYYDRAYDESADFNNPNDWKFVDETKDLHRDKVEILDAFAYGLFEVGDHSINLRIGKQVASWGESLFILNGVSAAQSPIDATAANVPGVELKDLFLPVEQILLEIGLSDSLTLSTFYQWKWDKTRLDEAGSYFSTTNLVDDGIRDTKNAFLRGADKNPDDDGQWGAALRFMPEALEGTEFGLYYINYHEKLPYVENTVPLLISFAGLPPALGGGQYWLNYSDNVQLYGASVSSMVGDTNVAFEASYRKDLSVQVEQEDMAFPITGDPATDGMLAYVSDLINTSERNWNNEDVDVLQVQMSSISILPQTSFYDNLTVTAEVGVNRVVGGRDGKKLWNDRTAWGGTVKAAFDYFQVLQNLDLQIPITYKFNPNGVSSVLGTFDEKDDSIGTSFDFTYDAVYKLGLGYTAFLNDAEDNNKADRDFYSLNLKYTF